MDDVRLEPIRRGLAERYAAAITGVFARARTADRRGPGPADLPGAGAEVLLAVLGDEPVGIAWWAGRDPAELVVDPAHRGRGVGTRLAGAVLRDRGLWAHGTLPAAVAVAEAVGARPVRTMLQLRRDLAGPFVPQVPPGVQIRTFVPGRDEAAFLGVNARAFAWHPEQGRLDLAGLHAQMTQEWFDPAGFFLAVRAADGDSVLGFHWTKVHRQDPTPPPGYRGPVGEVYVLAVDPDSPIRRLGEPLTLAGLAHLAARGLQTVMLYVESDNASALSLYRRLGFADYATDTVFALP